jgi:lysophospholipase L1-like esterase
MKYLFPISAALLTLLLSYSPAGEAAPPDKQSQDWPDLGRYRSDNEKLGPPRPGENRVVFMGDSITDAWGRNPGTTFFPGKPYINRGISGQTTPQMLIRFRPDVVALRPKVVVILAGTNDIAGNTGLMSLEDTESNFMSMVDIARQNGIRVVLASLTPAFTYPWRPGVQPAARILALNTWLKEYAKKTGSVYLDYYSAMVDARPGMKANLSKDGVHPNNAGYQIMAPLAEKAIEEAVGKD